MTNFSSSESRALDRESISKSIVESSYILWPTRSSLLKIHFGHFLLDKPPRLEYEEVATLCA